jgi:hypothetical protein
MSEEAGNSLPMGRLRWFFSVSGTVMSEPASKTSESGSSNVDSGGKAPS